jgi:phosphatidylglycerol:prolipoprotein diacylglycerol transferase
MPALSPTAPRMLIHPAYDPVAIAIGPLAIRWYGLMYLIAFLGTYVLGRWRIARGQGGGATLALLDDLQFFGVLGVILGGRLGYVLFYKPAYYLSHPLEIFAVWQGGMAFHGGFLGVLLAMLWVARRHQLRWLAVTDFIAPLVPIGLAAGRLGNYLNGELWGRVTDVPWGMLFAHPAAGALPRHPSQLYQMGLEGFTLFALLWWHARRPRPLGELSALFLIGYGSLRFIAEWFREPDDFLGLLSLGWSMGQWLSLPMIVAGVWMLRWSRRAAATQCK